MPIQQNYPKNVTPDQKFGLAVLYPTDYNPNQKYMVWIIAHGIGEKGDGSNTALNRVLNWASSSGEGWTNVKAAVDREKFIAVFLNFSNNYDIGEGMFALEWIKRRLPVDPSRIFYLGHSLGSYIAGRYLFLNQEFANDIAGWLVSASGNFGDNAALWGELQEHDIRILGVTAENDTVMGTTPLAVTRIADRMLQLDPYYPVTVLKYPSTIWTDVDSHNAVLTVFTRSSLNTLPLTYTKGYQFPTKPQFKMNIYQWAHSNPKGSIPKMLDEYPGAVFPNEPTTTSTSTTTTTTKKLMTTAYRIGYAISDNLQASNTMVIEIFWNGAPIEKHVITSFYHSDKYGRIDLVLQNGTKKSINKTKTV